MSINIDLATFKWLGILFGVLFLIGLHKFLIVTATAPLDGLSDLMAGKSPTRQSARWSLAMLPFIAWLSVFCVRGLMV